MGVWQEIWNTVRSEFSDIPDVAQATLISVRLLVAVALGGLLGWERELRGKAAGVRTHMLVAAGRHSSSSFLNKPGITCRHEPCYAGLDRRRGVPRGWSDHPGEQRCQPEA